VVSLFRHSAGTCFRHVVQLVIWHLRGEDSITKNHTKRKTITKYLVGLLLMDPNGFFWSPGAALRGTHILAKVAFQRIFLQL